jgi:hypothetical protein
MKLKKLGPFKWNGLFWYNQVVVGNALLDIGILASEGQTEIVAELGPIAIRFPYFWEANRESIVEVARRWLGKVGSKDDARPKQCSLETVVLASGWTVGLYVDKQNLRKPFFELLLSFEHDRAPIYGDGVKVQISGALPDDLVVNPKQLDVQFLDL